MDGRSPGLLGGGSWLCFKHPVVRCQVSGTDLRSSAVLTLSLLLPTFPHGPHTNFLYGKSRVPAPEQKIFPRLDRTDAVLGRNSTRNGSGTITSKCCRLNKTKLTRTELGMEMVDPSVS